MLKKTLQFDCGNCVLLCIPISMSHEVKLDFKSSFEIKIESRINTILLLEKKKMSKVRIWF